MARMQDVRMQDKGQDALRSRGGAKGRRRRARDVVASAALLVAVLAGSLLAGTGPLAAQSRIKDIVDIEGVRDNQLVGYGLVVGLNGTGDDLDKAVFTRESLIGMLQRLGVNARDADLETDNVAAVMVTANFPAFGRLGSRIDVTISALGDSESLLGGNLLVTPLLGADGEVYAVAQGPVAVGGFSAGGEAETVTRGVPTTGRIPNGAIVEREVPFALNDMQRVKLSLRNPDLSTAGRIAGAINGFLREQRKVEQASAEVTDPGTVTLSVPEAYRGRTVALLGDIEQLPIKADQIAKIVIDERSGVIVMGQNVRISTVAIAQGNLTIRITETPQVSQPGPFAEAGETEVVPRTQIQIDDQNDNRLAVVEGNGVSLQQLVDGLNALGIGPRDLISILQTIKAAGALQAEIEVM